MSEEPENTYDEIYESSLRASRDFAREQLKASQSLINSFTQLCANKSIELADSDIEYVRTIGVVATHPGLLTRLTPKLQQDKEGLFDCETLYEIFQKTSDAPGYLFCKDFAAMAHPYFRRGFYEKNNFAPAFLDLFWSLDLTNIDAFLALQIDRVRIDVGGPRYMEADTWYGAPFDSDISEIPDGVAKLRSPTDLSQHHLSFFFHDAYSLDIKWHEQNRIKTFQAEEFKTERVQVSKGGSIYHPVRYFHAEYDVVARAFRHMDGAIHYLTPEEYLNRRESDLNFNRKLPAQIKSESEKLFKINGEIQAEIWAEALNQFFAANPLVYEYFSGSYPAHIIEILAKLRATTSNS